MNCIPVQLQGSSLKLDRWSTALLHQQEPKHSKERNFSIQKEVLPQSHNEMQKMAEFEVEPCTRQEGALGLLRASPLPQGTGATLCLQVPYTKEACPSFSPWYVNYLWKWNGNGSQRLHNLAFLRECVDSFANYASCCPEAATSEAEKAHCLLVSDSFECVHTHSNSHADTVCICECQYMCVMMHAYGDWRLLGFSSRLPLWAGFCGGAPWLLIENKQNKKPPSTLLLTHPSSLKTVSILPPVKTLSPASKSGWFHSAHWKLDTDTKQLELRVQAKHLKWLHHFSRLGKRSVWHFDPWHRGWPLCCVILETDLMGPTPRTMGLAEPGSFLVKQTQALKWVKWWRADTADVSYSCPNIVPTDGFR